MAIPKSNEKLQFKIIEDSWNTYVCASTIWTSELKSEWSITKIDADWNVTYPVRNETWLPTYWFWFLPAEAATLVYSYN